MRAESVERLLLKVGETPNAGHIRALDAAIVSQRNLGGSGVRRKIFPWGTHQHYTAPGGGGSYVSPYFEPSATFNGSNWEITWERGTIAGASPELRRSKPFKPFKRRLASVGKCWDCRGRR